MTVTHTRKLFGLLLLMIVPSVAMGQASAVRPGKGMSIIPGDFAEYSNTEYQGEKKTVLHSTIMLARGTQDDMEAVQVISVKDGKLLSNRTVFYDLTQEKVERGELLKSGRETVDISGKKYECTWEKRRDRNVIATFWRCSDLPFEKYAKVQMEADDGRKMITELVLHGPDPSDNEAAQKFLKRLQDLIAQPGSEKPTPRRGPATRPSTIE